MDRTERPAASAGAQSGTVRGLPDNPAQGRRPVPNSAATSNGPAPPPSVPVPPVPTNSNAPPNGNLSASRALTSTQVINLTRDAMRTALESEGQAAEVNAAGAGIKSGVTIDLSRKNIHKLPEDLVDIVKDKLERLALSHNQLSTLPARFSECISLRYLNIRGNQIKEFPMALCDLDSLEILDLGRNQLRVLPPEISKLVSLKVLSVPKNHIRELPLCLADMGSLQVLKFEGNPISFPPKDAFQLQASSPPNDRDSEVTEVAVTAHIKKFLRLHAINGRVDSDGTGDESETAETPRMPLKRVASGRFPIRVNGSDVSDMRSPNMPRAPPIPSRSHYRGLSQQSTSIRRPGVMPLTIAGNVGERGRSNSESARTDRPEKGTRRLGVVSKKTSELDTLEETDANNRFSHYRGLSHGSAMTGNPIGSKSPATPTEQSLQRPIYVRRLSVLPERRRESKVFDPVIETAKGILYSVFQIHPMIQMLMTLTNDGSEKRSSLEIVFYNTNSHVEQLEQEIQKYDNTIAEEDDFSAGENQSVHRACETLVGAYSHVCTLLADNIDTIVNNGDARYIRSLLMLLYNSIMELRATLNAVSATSAPRSMSHEDIGKNNDTIRAYPRDGGAPGISAGERTPQTRSRNGTVVHSPANARNPADGPGGMSNGSRRTPALPPVQTRLDQAGPNRGLMIDTGHEEMLFNNILSSLQRATDAVLQTLPNYTLQLSGRLRSALQQRAPDELGRELKNIIAMCNTTVQQTEVLKSTISTFNPRDPAQRSQPAFWAVCNNFVLAWTRTAVKMKDNINKIPLPPDTRVRLRPIQQAMKDIKSTIIQSPWQHMFQPMGAGGSSSQYGQNILSPNQMPITPQSAALGPAMQATVPITPQSASFAGAFQGNVFDRADALMANPGIGMARGASMQRGHSNLSSMSSISSQSSDGVSTPSSMFSPNGNGGGQFGPSQK